MRQLVLGLPSRWERDHPDDLVVRPETAQFAPGRAFTIRAALGSTEEFRRTLEGFYVRVVTLQNLLHQFGGDWEEIVINWPGQSRALFWDPVMQPRLNTAGVLQTLWIPEDGNNHEVVHRACFDCGFKSHVEDEWLVIHR